VLLVLLVIKRAKLELNFFIQYDTEYDNTINSIKCELRDVNFVS
jgi:hypothetical protein